MSWTDQKLYEALCGAGPLREDAIVELRRLLLRGLSKSLQNRYGGLASPEDIVQEALIRILKSLDRFEGRSRFTTWAVTIATRIGISALRRKSHLDQSLGIFSGDNGGRIDLAVAAVCSPAATQTKAELIQRLQVLIDESLTVRQRIVIRAYLSDYSTDGIAEAMGTNRNAVYKLLHDARMKLKEGLEATGYNALEVFITLSEAEAG